MRNNRFNAAMLAAGLLIGLPAIGSAQGLQLKPGWTYAIAFPEAGNGNGPAGGNTPPPGGSLAKGVALYKVLGAADQNWYRVRMITRGPQGALMPIPNAPEAWVNLNYAMWVQEVIR